MNILFMTIGGMKSIEDYSIYCDLLRCFRDNTHKVYTISPYEKREGKQTEYKESNGVYMLHVKTGNLTRANSLIEKGIATLSVESIFINAIKKYFSGVKFDLVMYSTPPITFYKVVEYVKKRDGAKTYLLLKDIFPQNAVDIGLMTKTGLKVFLYKYFRRKEKKLYAISDYIGCMSKANIDYVIKHNPEINPAKVEICPNSVEVRDLRLGGPERMEMRKKYDIPINKKVFIYGGNLGKPQGIPFIIKCLECCKNKKDAYFLIIGDGTEYGKLEAFFTKEKPENMKLMKCLPKEDYDRLVAACDVGLIFLDYRFTIPNFPSRLLSYMQAGLPVLACTDINTDIGKVIVEGRFGYWCESNDVKMFQEVLTMACKSNLKDMGENAYRYLNEKYSAAKSYEIIMKSFDRIKENEW